MLVCIHNHRNIKGEKKEISKLLGNKLLFIFPELAKKMAVVIREFIDSSFNTAANVLHVKDAPCKELLIK